MARAKKKNIDFLTTTTTKFGRRATAGGRANGYVKILLRYVVVYSFVRRNVLDGDDNRNHKTEKTEKCGGGVDRIYICVYVRAYVVKAAGGPPRGISVVRSARH